jgi:excisionase family DNA binding protein
MEIYDVPELAEMLRVSEKTIRAYLKEGQIHGRKIGKRWLVSEDALKAFMMQSDSKVNASSLVSDWQ